MSERKMPNPKGSQQIHDFFAKNTQKVISFKSSLKTLHLLSKYYLFYLREKEEFLEPKNSLRNKALSILVRTSIAKMCVVIYGLGDASCSRLYK